METVAIPKSQAGVEPALLSYRQAREVLNVGETKLRQLVRDGHLAAKMHGRRPAILTVSVRGYIAGLPDVMAKGRRS